MSGNIHGFNEISGNGNNSAPPNQLGMLGNNVDTGLDPRSETFSQFFKDFLCPSFSFKSFIFICSAIDVAVYIITISFGIKMSPYELLAPKPETLEMFGMKVKST